MMLPVVEANYITMMIQNIILNYLFDFAFAHYEIKNHRSLYKQMYQSFNEFLKM